MAASKKRQRADLLAYLLDFLKKHVSPGQHLLLGLSGGLDSCVLLDLLVRAREHFDFQLSAIHVNHGISPNAVAWAEFCAKLCASYDVCCHIVAVEVPRDTGFGLEAAARAARYSAIASCHEAVVLLAHHRDDQAETVLLQLLRGAGVHGLAAMPIVTCAHIGKDEKQFLRPLLDFPRLNLLEYAQARGLAWVDDESNLDAAYDRNFLRLDVFPRLEQRFPALSNNLARSAQHLGEAAELLDEIALCDAGLAISGDRVSIQALRELSGPRTKNLLRWWIKSRTGVVPSSAKLAEVMKQLHAKPDAQLCVNLGEFEFRRYRHWGYVERQMVPLPFSIDWQGEEVVELPHVGRLTFKQTVGAGIACRLLRGGGMTIRSRSGGEHLQPDHRRPRRSLKNLFQEAGIPAWRRAAIPLVYIDQQLVFVPEVGIEYDFQVINKDELGVLIEWHPLGHAQE